ncbi:MAG TPA: hypothetical protein VD993_09035 [Chitinophagaceae bacterium]|nr:hypothetical protein [Chitinophagaceae bacterium]
MNPQFEKNAGIALIVFTILMTFTMVLHPAGGSFEYLLKVKMRIITTHAIALCSLPFALVGFWGLTRKLGTEYLLSVSALATMIFGLIAVMMAATVNGLVLPIFIQRYEGASPEVIESLKPLLRYNFSINNAFDYIYTAAFCLAILFWSIAIIRTRKLPVSLAYAGLVLSVIAAVIFEAGFAGHLGGFRLFVTSIVIWILLVGLLLARTRANIP